MIIKIICRLLNFLSVVAKLEQCIRSQSHFARKISCAGSVIVVLSSLLILMVRLPCLAEGQAIWGRDSWNQAGLFCFRTFTATNRQIHLAKYSNGIFVELFVKNMENPIQSPICLRNVVIAVNSGGVIAALDFNGNSVFAAKPEGFAGASGWSGKVSDTCIFMSETIANKQENKFDYFLYFVDVSGEKPLVKAKFIVIQPWAITQTDSEVVVVGSDDVLRLRIPKECK